MMLITYNHGAHDSSESLMNRAEWAQNCDLYVRLHLSSQHFQVTFVWPSERQPRMAFLVFWGVTSAVGYWLLLIRIPFLDEGILTCLLSPSMLIWQPQVDLLICSFACDSHEWSHDHRAHWAWALQFSPKLSCNWSDAAMKLTHIQTEMFEPQSEQESDFGEEPCNIYCHKLSYNLI